MDRLEKALEKARQLRESELATQPTGAGQTVASANRATTGYTRPLNSEPMTVGEAQLERHRVLAHHTRNPEADIFRILRTQILQIMNKSGYRTLAITSPNYGDGKTTIALNLGMSIALDLKQTVLLVDLDLRKPNLHEFLGLERTRGLSDHLLDNVPLSDCLTRLSFDRLSILPAGRPLDNSSEVLGSPKMAALANELKTRYPDRMIIYDMPPVLAQDDPIAFLPHVEATLMVVYDGVTRVNDLKQCLNVLSNANIIGTVLNNAHNV
ncbi:MAG TPA: CpsD/CapB family tyrosine-protein kinase [Alphaproteobacteria bacterium]|nr:CpsD/CapB family tyrosine-protein kinase [Alphaproteobacteria bacterium]